VRLKKRLEEEEQEEGYSGRQQKDKREDA